MVKEVTQYTIDTEAIARAVALVSKETDTSSTARAALTALDTLHSFIVGRTQKRSPIDTLGDPEAQKVVERIAWFMGVEAERYLESHKEQLEKVFGFARCLSKGWAFITTDGGVTMLTGYDNNLPIEHGMMQLDGTAKLGGYEQLELPDRIVLPGPKVSFGNMHAVIEKPPTRTALAKYLANDADNFLTYRNWMIDTIRKHAKPGQKVLVVCKMKLVGMKYFPAWDHKDRRWETVNYQTDFGYQLPPSGQPCVPEQLPDDDQSGSAADAAVIHVSTQWWGGPSTGHNAWQDADAVFLFDAAWTPRHKVLADMGGLCRAAAADPDGPIAEMHSLRKQSPRFKDYRTRCMMAAHVQAACRGNLRRWDTLAICRQAGDTEGARSPAIIPECGKQLLVCGISDDAWLLENWREMFPGAPPPTLIAPQTRQRKPKGSKQDWAGRLRELLAQPGLGNEVNTRWIGEQWGVEWRKVSKEALKAMPVLKALGWTYRGGKGKAPSVFRR
jgi:hypothetical protein